MTGNVVSLQAKKTGALSVKISTSSGNLGKVGNKTMTWGQLCERLGATAWDNVTMKEFKAKSIAWQHKRKNQGYFVGGQFKGGARKLQNMSDRSMLTFDIDNCSVGLLADIQVGMTWLGDFEYFYYTTRSHTPESPRVRVVVPMVKPIAIAELAPLSRIIAQKLDNAMEAVDPVSFRPAQVMYWPNTCRNAEFLSGRNIGALLDGHAQLEAFGDWKDYAKLPRSEREKPLRESGDKVADPLTKRGVVGAVNRAFSITSAMETFLSDVYEVGEAGHDGQIRCSYLPGSTRNGAVIYDDDTQMFSNHGTDPCADMLVNTFDMLRIHLYGDLDKPDAEGFLPEKPQDMPSYKSMVEFCSGQKTIMREMRDDNYDVDAIMADTELEDEDYEEPQKEAKAHGEPVVSSKPSVDTRPEVTSKADDKDWRDDLELTDKGIIKMTLHNLTVILINDPRFRGKLAYNEFVQESVLIRRIRSKQFGHDTGAVSNKENGDYISGYTEAAIRAMIEAPRGESNTGYSLRVSDRDMKDAIATAAMEFRFHPVKNYLRRCYAKWDGVTRMRKLFSTYAHAADTPYHEAVAYNSLVGAVARIFEPGCKYDFVTILEGIQGIRKSTFISILAGTHRFGELKNNFDDTAKLVEQIQGKWIVEIPELVQFSRTDIETLKSIFSAEKDRTRLAWGRGAKDYLRQNVFWGTTNRRVYLKDEENRRYWPVKIPAVTIDTEGLLADVDQIWAEAYNEYLWMRRQFPNTARPLPLFLDGELAEAQKEITQARTEVSSEEMLAGQVVAWLNTPVHEAATEVGYRGDLIEDIDDRKLLLRNRVCIRDILYYVLGKPDNETDQRLSQQLSRIMADRLDWKRHGVVVWIPRLGSQRVFDRILND